MDSSTDTKRMFELRKALQQAVDRALLTVRPHSAERLFTDANAQRPPNFAPCLNQSYNSARNNIMNEFEVICQEMSLPAKLQQIDEWDALPRRENGAPLIEFGATVAKPEQFANDRVKEHQTKELARLKERIKRLEAEQATLKASLEPKRAKIRQLVTALHSQRDVIVKSHDACKAWNSSQPPKR